MNDILTHCVFIVVFLIPTFGIILSAKYMIKPRHPNSGQNQNIRIANVSFENVATFKYNQNDIHDEIKSRLNSGNACYYSVQNLLSSHLI
jgi:hypothetical protein